ncbi:tripartite tricarboxylate transporter TctB family protein [Hydromonas duriensis]|uniref:Putative tricarboxylic transport membrane protein n=1 Tax=Hydromonas duriensis TaxID=1527608 RepID=A0A4R6YA68_9BURK|nr:tripartite tricarboxylate transporter TctB family protein [Hydromonas duriensis]TDR32367.1 putative tricarboxylic transport membrane protein [Hydromonas duriensis]
MSRRSDFIASLCFFLTGAFFVVASSHLADNVIGGAVTPATFPKAFGALLCFLSVILLLETLKKKATESKQQHTQHAEDEKYHRRFFIILSSMVLYILLIEPLGFIISTFLFLVVSFQAMERGNIGKTVAIAGGFSLVLYFVFIKLLEASVQSWPSFLS